MTFLSLSCCRISKNIPTTKDVEPLLEIDGDVRNFEVFLASRTPVLVARDVKTFLPCTVNLDPKLREIIAGACRPARPVHAPALLPVSPAPDPLRGGRPGGAPRPRPVLPLPAPACQSFRPCRARPSCAGSPLCPRLPLSAGRGARGRTLGRLRCAGAPLRAGAHPASGPQADALPTEPAKAQARMTSTNVPLFLWDPLPSRRPRCPGADQHRRPGVPPAALARSRPPGRVRLQPAPVRLLLGHLLQRPVRRRRGVAPAAQQLLQRAHGAAAPVLQPGEPAGGGPAGAGFLRLSFSFKLGRG